MGVYRSDQAQLTFAAEAAQGGDPELMQGASGSSSTTLSAAAAAGARSITVASASGFTVGDFIRIGTVEGTYANTTTAHEVRRLESIDGTTFNLDRPLAFYHAQQDDGTNTEVQEVTGVGNESIGAGDNSKFITFIPGIYETIDTPDPEMSIEGRRFLSTQSKRNFSVAYSGQQSLTGSVSGIVLLNGWALRFPIGSVTTTPSAVATDTILLNGAVKKGDIFITTDGSDDSNLDAGNYIQIIEADGTNSEVRRIVADVSDTFKLNYPLQFDHADNALVHEIAHSTSIVYTHVIEEQVDLDTVSWHVHMKDSTETAAKDFDRRYVGGMIGSSTISAEEGGMVTMSWDSVNFLNMVHNQANQSTVGTASGDLYDGASVEANMPRFGLMQTIDSDDVGMPSHMSTITDANTGVGYPSNQPYYFSEGTIKFFDQEFARIRSFSLSIANNEEPRYYIGKQGARARGPYEIKEGPRDYALSASVVLPDADKNAAATIGGSGDAGVSQDTALELFKQLLLEGDYGAGGGSKFKQGFTATIKFERGTNDHIIIDIPGSSTAGTPTAATNQLNKQGIFINSAPHSVTGDNPFQVDLDMMFRSLKITILDNEPIYP